MKRELNLGDLVAVVGKMRNGSRRNKGQEEGQRKRLGGDREGGRGGRKEREGREVGRTEREEGEYTKGQAGSEERNRRGEKRRKSPK